MPFHSLASNVGGDLPEPIRNQINAFVSLVDREVEELARTNGLTPSQVRLLRPCNVVYVVNQDTVFAVLTNVNVGGLPRHLYVNWIGPMNLHTAYNSRERWLLNKLLESSFLKLI